MIPDEQRYRITQDWIEPFEQALHAPEPAASDDDLILRRVAQEWADA